MRLKAVVYVLTGTILAVVLTSCGSDEAPAPHLEGGFLLISETAETKTGSATIRSFELLVTAQHDEVQPRVGFIFAVIEMEGCVSGARSGAIRIYADDIQLLLTDDTRLSPTRAVREPALQQITIVRAGTCARGFLTYGVPRDSKAAFVIYEVVPRPQVAKEQDIVTLRWAIP